MPSTGLSSCLKSWYLIAGTGATTFTTAARNLFAEANFSTRSTAGANIGYNTTNNQITFSHVGTRFIEVIFVGGGGATTFSQTITISFILSGIAVKTMRVFSTASGSIPRQVASQGIYAVTSGSTLQINYSGGTNCYITNGSSVLVRFIS